MTGNRLHRYKPHKQNTSTANVKIPLLDNEDGMWKRGLPSPKMGKQKRWPAKLHPREQVDVVQIELPKTSPKMQLRKSIIQLSLISSSDWRLKRSDVSLGLIVCCISLYMSHSHKLLAVVSVTSCFLRDIFFSGAVPVC